MHRLNNLHCRNLLVRSGFFALLLWPPLALCAQAPQPANPHTASRREKKGKEYTISVDVNEVVLHATVIDKRGHIVNDLKQDDFQCL